MDVTDDRVGTCQTVGSLHLERASVDLDPDAEIDPAEADQVSQVIVRGITVLSCVERDDVSAAAADQLVNPQVLEMAAIGEMHELSAIVGPAEELGQNQVAELLGSWLSSRWSADSRSSSQAEH